MINYPSDVDFTSSVKAVQEPLGSRQGYSRMERGGGWETSVTADLPDFMDGLDMFNLGTANAAGQPSIQHRRGPPGSLKVMDENTLAFANIGGNQQYITVVTPLDNPKAFLFLIDYATSR